MPAWPDAMDPAGKRFALSPQGKAAIGLFLLACIWWVFEVIPIGLAAIAIVLPVALVIANYLGEAPDVVMCASLVTSGMPFLLRIGAVPNAIAYDSRQFSTSEFFRHGLLLSVSYWRW